MRTKVLGALVALASLAAVAVAAPESGESSETKRPYLVQLSERPAISYTGGVAGIPATKPAKGQKINRDDANVKEYVSYLRSKHDAALAKVGRSIRTRLATGERC